MLFTIGSLMQIEDAQLGILDLKSGQQKILVRRGFAGNYLDTGHLIYAMVGSQGTGQKIFATLWVVGFDLDRLELRGEPVRVGETLQVDMVSATNYAVSRSGALAYVPARAPGAVLCVGRSDRARDGNRRAAAASVRHFWIVPRRHARGILDPGVETLRFGPGISHENPRPA